MPRELNADSFLASGLKTTIRPSEQQDEERNDDMRNEENPELVATPASMLSSIPSIPSTILTEFPTTRVATMPQYNLQNDANDVNDALGAMLRECMKRWLHRAKQIRPRLNLTLYPNRPVLLSTGLVLVNELAIARSPPAAKFVPSAKSAATTSFAAKSATTTSFAANHVQNCALPTCAPPNSAPYSASKNAPVCMPVFVKFDAPVKRACLLVVWLHRRIVEYIDPNAAVPCDACGQSRGHASGPNCGRASGPNCGHASDQVCSQVCGHAFDHATGPCVPSVSSNSSMSSVPNPLVPCVPDDAFESHLRTICVSCWNFAFRGTEETFGPSRWYASDEAPLGALRDCIFPPPQRASHQFLRNAFPVNSLHGPNGPNDPNSSNEQWAQDSRLESTQTRLRRRGIDLETLAHVMRQAPKEVHEIGKVGTVGTVQEAQETHKVHEVQVSNDKTFRDDLFWILHTFRQACRSGRLVGEWIQSRDWYEGTVDYATTGARMAKHLLRVLDEDVAQQEKMKQKTS
jgi:hypothetical protein